ncbi:MAG: DsbA family protein [Solirubrobacterales bacterium]|nr:DsbA family protein [Solirubrobacterales bacterium]
MALNILRITDSGCPFAYAAGPALSVLRHRYGTQINWRLAMIGLAEHHSLYEEKGFTGEMMAISNASFSRRYGVPVTSEARARPLATWLGCKSVVAARLNQPELEANVHRALQIGWFTTTLALDEEAPLLTVLEEVDGLDAKATVEAAVNDQEVAEAFAEDRRKARSAQGSPTEAQNKHAMDGDLVRYTAPSLLVTSTDGRQLEAGGFQPVEAYDVIIANADPTLTRHTTETAAEALEASPWGLCPAEVAAILAAPLSEPDVAAAEVELIKLVVAGDAKRVAAGNGAFYSIA